MLYDDMSVYFDDYKNNYVASRERPTAENKVLLEKSKTYINSVLTELTIEDNRLKKQNKKKGKEIAIIDSEIKKTKKKYNVLEKEADAIKNSDLGAVEQNINFKENYRRIKLNVYIKMAMIVLILIFLYINGDIIQSISTFARPNNSLSSIPHLHKIARGTRKTPIRTLIEHIACDLDYGMPPNTLPGSGARRPGEKWESSWPGWPQIVAHPAWTKAWTMSKTQDLLHVEWFCMFV